MPDQPTPATSNDMILGELRGSVKELVHSVNNLRQEVHIISEKVSGLGSVSRELAEVKVIVAHHEAQLGTAVSAAREITALKEEVESLKAERSRRDGASSQIASILKSPLIAYPVAALISLFAYLSGKGAL